MSVASVMTELGSVIGALGVGSVLGQYLASSKDRREARARVLDALAKAEATRWVRTGPSKDAPFSEFQASIRALQTAALIARLPRDAIWEYAVLAQAARWLSEESYEQDPDDGGGVESHVANATREAARAVSTLTWSWGPTHALRWRRAKRQIGKQLSQLNYEDAKTAVERSRRYGVM